MSKISKFELTEYLENELQRFEDLIRFARDPEVNSATATAIFIAKFEQTEKILNHIRTH